METPQSTPSPDIAVAPDYQIEVAPDYQIESVALVDRAIQIRWNDGIDSTYHYIWLRDNCPSAFHPHTGERSFDLLSVSKDIHPQKGYEKSSLSIFACLPNMPSPFVFMTAPMISVSTTPSSI